MSAPARKGGGGQQEVGVSPVHEARLFAEAAEEFISLICDRKEYMALLLDHYQESADNPRIEHRIGQIGSNCEFNSPYLDNSLSITTQKGIDAVENGIKELSACYRYDPVFKPGTFNGKPYDFVMTNIRGNHVAIVRKGRAGSDVAVADSDDITINKRLKAVNLRKRGSLGMTEKKDKKKMPWFAKLLLASDELDTATGETTAVPVKELARIAAYLEAKKSGYDTADFGYELGEDAGTAEVIKATFPGISEEDLNAIVQILERGEKTIGDEGGEEDPLLNPPANPAEGETKEPVVKDTNPVTDPKSFAQGVMTAEEMKTAMDAQLKEAELRGTRAGTEAAKAHFQSLVAARDKVRPLVGEVSNFLAYDSAEDLYAHALKTAGYSIPKDTPKSAYVTLVGMACMNKRQSVSKSIPVKSLAMDSDDPTIKEAMKYLK